MSAHRLQRQLRKELLVLKAEACRAEIRREATALASSLAPRSGASTSWAEHPLLQMLTAGSGPTARWLRWGLLAWRWWPALRSLWAAVQTPAAASAPTQNPAPAAPTAQDQP